jgi:hypothetical protein
MEVDPRPLSAEEWKANPEPPCTTDGTRPDPLAELRQIVDRYHDCGGDGICSRECVACAIADDLRAGVTLTAPAEGLEARPAALVAAAREVVEEWDRRGDRLHDRLEGLSRVWNRAALDGEPT